MSEKSCNNCLYQKICLDFGITTEAHPEDLCGRFENKDEWVHLPCVPGAIVYRVVMERYCTDEYRMDWDEERIVVACPFDLGYLNDMGKTTFLTRSEAEDALERMNTKNR